MELLHVLGNTWAAVAATALLPVYKLTDRDVVLIDTGYAKLDRAGLTSLIDANGWRLVLDGLPRAGFTSIAAADGAFYLWCDVGHLTNDSAAFCAEMLDQAGIAATTGLDFDRGRGSRFLRFSYCGTEAEMVAAPERLRSWLRR